MKNFTRIGHGLNLHMIDDYTFKITITSLGEQIDDYTTTRHQNVIG